MDKDGQTALHLACINGREDDIKMLISAGADVNKLNAEGSSPLMLLAQAESECKYECMKLLIDSGANVKIIGREGKQAIHPVLFSGDLKCVKLLLENGADSSAALSNKKTLLHFAALENWAEIARLLVEHKADLNMRDELMMTPLMVAAIKHSVEVLRIIIDAGADVTKKAENGMTALHIAGIAHHEKSAETVRLLCEGGVPMDTKDERGMCAIHCHLDFQRTANVKVLLENGCDADLMCSAGFTPLMRICSPCNDHDEDGQLELIRILLRGGADVNATSTNGNTALSYASGKKKNLPVVRALLSAKCDVNVRDEQGDTPLHEAAMANEHETLRLLLKCGADCNAKNEQGETPLFLAAQEGHIESVKEFFRDVDKIAEGNRSAARAVAVRKGHQGVVAAINSGVPIAAASGEGTIDNLSNALHTSTINA